VENEEEAVLHRMRYTEMSPLVSLMNGSPIWLLVVRTSTVILAIALLTKRRVSVEVVLKTWKFIFVATSEDRTGANILEKTKK
jgi:hypothetical protein